MDLWKASRWEIGNGADRNRNGKWQNSSAGRQCGQSADWKSAIRQVGKLRYELLGGYELIANTEAIEDGRWGRVGVGVGHGAGEAGEIGGDRL